MVGRLGGDFVSQYFFIVRRADLKDEANPCAVILPNDTAALRYAERTITGLQKEKGYFDSTGFVIVKNEKDEVVLSVPFLPACA
jgi:hypothetical protein